MTNAALAPFITAPLMRCGACPIRERAVCSHCNRDELQKLDEIKSYRDYGAGAEIMGAGEGYDFVASIVSGVVKLLKTMPDGRTQMIGLLFPSDFVGHVMRDAAEYDAIAATDVRLCVFRRAPFEKMLKETPRLEHRLLQMTLDELDAAREWLLLLGRKTAREKVASLLLMLAQRKHDLGAGCSGRRDSVELPLTRAEIADYLGLTLETVSRQMSALKKDGVIGLEGKRHIMVPDFDLLMEETGDDSDGGFLV